MKLQQLQEAKYHKQNNDEINEIVYLITHHYSDSIYDYDPPDSSDGRLERIYDAITRASEELGYDLNDWDTEKAAEILSSQFFVNEARYHGSKTSDQVYDMYRELEHPSSGEVQVLDVEKYHKDVVLASLRVWTFAVNENEVRKIIKDFLNKHNVPYSHITEIANLHKGDWRATTVYGSDEV